MGSLKGQAKAWIDGEVKGGESVLLCGVWGRLEDRTHGRSKQMRWFEREK